jgi:hypothetical protein
VVLVLLVVVDVRAFQSIPSTVHVTAVQWYAGSEPLTTAQGFTLRGLESVTLTLSCDQICYTFAGASVAPPFHLVGFVLSNQTTVYSNVTVQAPSTAYTGPVSITLTFP